MFANGSLNYAKEKTTHIQVGNAPKATAAAGLLYKANGIRLSLIDKWTGPQYAIDESFNPTTGLNTLNRQVKIGAYNTAIVAASYEWRNVRVGVEVTDLFNSTKITNLGLSGSGPTSTTLNNNADQVYFQPGRQISGDLTVRF